MRRVDRFGRRRRLVATASSAGPTRVEGRLEALLSRLPDDPRLPRVRGDAAFLRVRECPAPTVCTVPDKYARRLAGDNAYTFSVHRLSGAYHCFRCGAEGSFRELERLLAGGRPDDRPYDITPTAAVVRPRGPPRPAQLVDAASSSSAAASSSEEEQGAPQAAEPRVLDARIAAAYVEALWDGDADESRTAVLRYLEETRGLEEWVVAMYGCGRAVRRFFDAERGRWSQDECVTFPWIRLEEKDDGDATTARPRHVRVKLRSIREKKRMLLEPKGGEWGLFGLHTVAPDATEVVLTEGEFDAMAVRQGIPELAAVSLPNGASSLPAEAMALLERFTKIYVWLDNDASGRHAAKRFADKLGAWRCRIVDVEVLASSSSSCSSSDDGDDVAAAEAAAEAAHHHHHESSWFGVKDANEALLKGLDLRAAIDAAPEPTHARIVDFAGLRRDVLSELRNPEAARGAQCASFPQLMEKLRGIRPGEVTLLTGPTGGGKTTLASQLSLDLCAGADGRSPVLWGSFEVKNSKLAIKMLRQMFQRRPKGTPLADDSYLLEKRPAADIEALCDQMERLPLYFMTFHGATRVDDVVDAMEFAYHAKDTVVVVLDNLQFLTEGADPRSSAHVDKFRLQDAAFSRFRTFATERNVHVLLVVHPRKEDPQVKLHINSIYGGGKATQEADNVLILNNLLPPADDFPPVSRGPAAPAEKPAAPAGFKELEVAKNRDAGILGRIQLRFNEASVRYEELGSPRK